MSIDGGQSKEMIFEWGGKNWCQMVDYEKLPFCREVCFMRRHLFRGCLRKILALKKSKKLRFEIVRYLKANKK
jgi:hypothetical protein